MDRGMRGRGRRPIRRFQQPIPIPPGPIVAEPIVFFVPNFPDEDACQNFSVFIRAVREHVTEQDDLAFGIPIMRAPAAVNSPERYMRVSLVTHENQYTFYLDRSNLYIIGVHVNDVVYYFNDLREDMRAYLEGHGIEDLGHITLSFDCRYREMLGFSIGLYTLNFALYGFRHNNDDIWRESMLVAIQMISECARFRYLEEIVKQIGIEDPFNAHMLTDIDVSRQHSWAFNCTRIVTYCRQNPDQVAPTEALMQQLQDINDVSVLGLLKPP